MTSLQPQSPSPSPTSRIRPTDLIPFWPRITRYYGIPPHVLQHYPTWMVEQYLDAIVPLEAEEQLWRMMAADHPHLTESSRKAASRKLLLAMNRDIEEGEKVDPISEDGQSALESIGIKVVIENHA